MLGVVGLVGSWARRAGLPATAGGKALSGRRGERVHGVLAVASRKISASCSEDIWT